MMNEESDDGCCLLKEKQFKKKIFDILIKCCIK